MTCEELTIQVFDPYVSEDLYPILLEEVPWVNRSSPRDECFMAVDTSLTYSYGNSNEHRKELHTYQAAPMHPKVLEIMEKLNTDFSCSYNVCVLNYYKDQNQHLGWHSDNSPEQDLTHPISVVSFGALREIWVKERSFKGVIPVENRFGLKPGSLFIMPGGFQENYLHRIPKNPTECGGRISLTFRKLDK